jgi:hypothetical protein
MISRYSNGSVILQFGTGDIGIYIGGKEGCGALMFKQQQPQPIRFPSDFGATRRTEAGEYPVSILFTHPDSIEMFIQSLQRAKKVLAGELVMTPEKQESEE